MLNIAQQHLLASSDLDEAKLKNTLNYLLSANIDFADIYLQELQSESWYLEDSIVKSANYSAEKGFGIRTISGERTALAYSNEIDSAALQKATTAVKSIAHGKSIIYPLIKPSPAKPKLYESINPLSSLNEQQKVALLQNVDAFTRQLDPRISQVAVSLAASYTVIMVIATDGALAADVRPLVRFDISVVAEENGNREKGYAGGGGRFNYDYFLTSDKAFDYAKEAVRQALINLTAIKTPAGIMPVILGAGWPAVLLHEAIGHGLEGDFNRKGTSAFANRLGEKVASPLCTIVDDGTLPLRRGSINIDDEGTHSQCTTLIENGILTGYLQDKFNAYLMGTKSTGNGRRENYACLPIPRMTNTYMLNGNHDPQEIISSVKHGLYAVNLSGGQVDITSGKFVFSTSEAYLIENGKITYPVKGASLIGDGPEILTKVSLVGNDLKLDDGVGSCGKDGQSAPVGVGQPTLKIDALTVGGTI